MVLSIAEARNLALKAEMMLSDTYRRFNTGDGFSKSSSYTDKGKAAQASQSSPKVATTSGSNKNIAETAGQGITPPKGSNPYTKLVPIKCFKCNELGHQSSDCPRRKVVNLVEQEEDEEGEDEVYCGPNEGKEEEEYDPDSQVRVVQKLMLSQNALDES